MANKKMDVMDSSLIYPAAVCCTCLLIKSTGIFLLKPVVICCSVSTITHETFWIALQFHSGFYVMDLPVL